MSSSPNAAKPSAGIFVLSAADLALYALVVFVWGTSWIGMRWQVGVVEPEVSVLWRFMIAFPIMFVWALARGQRLGHDAKAHVMFAGMGATMFSLNLIMFYNASLLITTGLMAVVFSIASLFNLVLSAVFMGQPIRLRMLLAGFVGLAGVMLMFAPEIAGHEMSGKALGGLALSALATLCFCSGNIISAAVQRRGIPVLSSSAWGMLYGAGLLLAISLVRGNAMIVDWSFTYIASLLWLAIVASVIAFAAFLTLIGRIGAPRAGYMTILFPVVALFVSTIVEGYRWTPLAVAGLVLVVTGNLLVLRGGSLRR